MRACRSVGKTINATRDTEPTRTPRKVTAAPGDRPPTEPSKYATASSREANRPLPPKNRIAAITIARPPRTKPPTAAGLGAAMAGLRLGDRFGSPHERLDGRMLGRVAQVARRAMADRGLGLGVEEHAVVADREQAGQLVADQDHGCAEAVAQLQDEFVEATRRDRVEAGRRLVEKQDI